MTSSINQGFVPELEQLSTQHDVKYALTAWHEKEDWRRSFLSLVTGFSPGILSFLFFFSFPPQCSGCISARENPTYTVLGTTSGRSHDTTPSQHPWPPTAWHDASPSYGWTANDANDGPTPTGNDAGWTCSRDEATDGRTHANDARAPDDETTLQTHDGANQAGNDPSRQIKVEMELPVLFHITIFRMMNTLALCP